MNKNDLVKSLSDSIMITENDAGIIVDSLFDIIKENLENGEEVKVRNFGTFFVQTRNARKAVNPIDQSPVDVPERKGIKFRASKFLNERLS